GKMPAIMLMMVDLPAPFSPNSTCTSPGRNSKPTPSSARTPGNCLTTPSRRSKGVELLDVEPCCDAARFADPDDTTLNESLAPGLTCPVEEGFGACPKPGPCLVLLGTGFNGVNSFVRGRCQYRIHIDVGQAFFGNH